jgi:2-keto-4-pentenoate hydratase/2-oxohepta-3-ene-1,7-dioic acid hydratase in catechol pathway
MTGSPAGAIAPADEGAAPMNWGIATVAGPAGGRLAVVRDGQLAQLDELLPGVTAPDSIQAMLEDWDRWVQAIDDGVAAPAGIWSSAENAALLTPIPDPPCIYCCGANYYDHVAEMGALVPDFPGFHKEDEPPFHFLIPREALIADGEPVVRPANCEQLDWEVELVAVIGRRADRVSVADALQYVAGYSAANDVSLRDPVHIHRLLGMNFLMAKGQHAMKPFGPVVVPARFVDDPQNVGLSLTVNGVTRQQSTTANMIFSLAEQIAHLSGMVTLAPGDIILTGTPAGTAGAYDAYLRDGDEMVATVEGIGSLHNRVVAREERSSQGRR